MAPLTSHDVDDDDVEISVVPSRRATVPDEPVETGEIVERRSRVVRSSNDPIPTLVPEEPTERTRSVAQPTPARRSWIGWLVATLVAAVAAVVLTVAVPPQATSTADASLSLQPTAELIATTLDGQARAALVRAEAIASSSMLRAGIQTDAATMADMARDQDVVFPIKPGETLEVFQVRAGVRTSLLRIPADAASVKPPAAGQIEIAQLGPAVTSIVNAGIPERDGVGGEVVMSVPIDLEPIKRRVDPRARKVTLIGLAAPVALVEAPGPGVEVAAVPIPVTVDHVGTLSLAGVVAVPPPAAPSSAIRVARYASFALAGLMALVLVVTLVRRRV
jgi:hypothetical protein